MKLLTLALSFAVVGGASAHAASGKVAWVIDGDTFRLEGGERIRIAGIDAAETAPDQAKCRAEIAIGKQATKDAIRLLKGRNVAFERVGRSYGRTIARVSLNGADLASVLMARGIARPWLRGQPKPYWCARTDEEITWPIARLVEPPGGPCQ